MLSRMQLNSSRVGIFIFWYSCKAEVLSWPDHIGYFCPFLASLLLSFLSRLHNLFLYSNINLYLPILPFERIICELKARRVFTQLKPPIKAFLKPWHVQPFWEEQLSTYFCPCEQNHWRNLQNYTFSN